MKIAFAGGGTLGPVTPLLAVARALKRKTQDAEFIWFGTNEGPERALVEAEGIAFFPITVAKLPRYLDIRWLTFPFDMYKAQSEAKEILLKEKPNAVVSVGGFTAVPVIRAASKLGIPCAIHQLDAVMSWSNRAIESLCASKTTSFARDGYKQIATPARFAGMTDSSARGKDKPTVLIVGGGTGAMSLNDAIAVKLDEWLERATVIHATGKGKRAVAGEYQGYTQTELLNENEMKQALAQADLVVTRAGIGGLSDVASCGKAAIIVPIPGNQQEENARLFKEAGAASVVEQHSGFAGELVAEASRILGDEALREKLGKTAQAFFKTDSGDELADEVLQIMK